MAGLNLFTNNAATTLASGLSSVATSLTVATGDGAEFPTLAGAEYFFCTIANNAGAVEIIKVTARSTDTFTIVRAQDGTTAVAWSSGDKVELRLTRIDLLNFPQLDSTNTFALAQTFTAAPVFNGGLGTPASGTLTSCTGLPLTTGVTGTLPIANGGTGTTSTTFVNAATNVTGTLPVANGGTGAATLTANNVILGNGTSAVAFVAPGTSGNVLTSNGTTWQSTASSGLTLLGTLAATSGTSQTLSVTLTSYKQLYIVFNQVFASGTNTAANNSIWLTTTSNAKLTNGNGTSACYNQGIYTLDLVSSVISGQFVVNTTANVLATTSGGGTTCLGYTGITTASTSLVFVTGGNAFTTGSILVYGVK